ncbi:cation diffusion facilitator family transporter [Halorussus salilacus]|uniref:cation diffusion facilitator family transporter n=1 Tax=Halorussus salilacus TaxID=2953750 RepID=UPI0020A0B709|nr:cation diffusion facilitator family transporter [Halorussus salilacus]USZ66702.1 cation diffusion facilitator family transporter [Halorussus salilacus]
MAESKSVVVAALIANGAIAVLKFFGFLLTGSAAMLSETYHSISDTGNQVFLLIGIRYSNRDASRGHPFGYGKAEFFYSFLVSVLLFGIAGWESAKHGYDAITHPGGHGGAEAATLLGYTFPSVYVNYVVLLGAIAFETYALKKAWEGMKADIEQHEWSGLREAFRKTSNVTTLTAFTEDTIALVGAGIALFGVYLTRVTGNYIYDAVSALLIGLMLMGFALALAWENKRLLLGESLPKDEERKLRRIVEDWDGVERIVDFRTVYFGPEQVMLATDIAFESGIATAEMDERITDLEHALMEANESLFKVYVEPEGRSVNRADVDPSR